MSNAGPDAASGVTFTDTLDPLLSFKSASAPAGTTYTVSGSEVTFSTGTIASGGSVTVSVTAQAIEHGSTSNTASVSSSSPDPNAANNNASAATSFTEPAISVSGSITTTNLTWSGQTAVFTHANGVEPASAFVAIIDWGDGTTSPGQITQLSDGSYSVTGSHTYSSGSNHTITTFVTEAESGIADLAVSVSGPASASEGDAVTYSITATNAGPDAVAGATFTDTLGPLLNYKSASAPAGTTFTVSGSKVTFLPGTIASGGSITVTVTAQAIEDGSTSNTASVSSSNPDPNVTNNNATAATSITEPAISVSGPITTTNRTWSGQTAVFTHANGVEPASAFAAAIDWGDGTTSPGQITQLSDGSYSVTGSHTYSSGSNHTITTLVTEAENGVSHNQRFISDLYLDLLNRPVDAAGLAFWDAQLSAGVTRTQVAFDLEQSLEYRQHIVANLYSRYLHRAADAGGLNYFAELLKQGVTIEHVAALLIGSSEFFAVQGGGTNDGFLNALYQDALGRPIDPGGLTWWNSVLAAGMPRSQVAALVLATGEYRQGVVQAAYQQFLGRAADAGGLSYWTNSLSAGATDQQLNAALAGSDEYYARTA